MPVNNPFALTAGIQYVDGTASTATSFTGTVAMSFNASNLIVGLRSDASDNLLVTGTLTHNNAAPIANNFGVLPAVASSAAPTYNAGDQVLLSTDLAGNLRVNATFTGTATNNITQWNSVNLGSPSAYGTSPGAVNVIGVNAFVTNTVAVSGTVTVNQGTSPWVVSLTSTTITGTVAVTQSTSPWVVAGALTNNNAAPAATLIGVMSHIAETAYTTVTYTTGDVVLATTDLHGATNVDMQAYAGTQLTGTVTAYGTAPTGNVFGVNAFITNTVPVTLTSTTITGTVAVTQSTSPWVVSLTSTTITGTVAVTQSTSPWTVQGDSASGAANAGNPVKIGGVFNTTQPTVTNGQTVDAQFTARGAQIVAVGVDGFAVTVGGTVAVTQSTSPWVVSLTSTTITGTVAVTQSTSPWVVSGNLTHNNAAPAANNVGVLPAVASTAAPTYTTGDQVLLSTDLAGNLRVTFAAASEQNVNLNQWAGTNLGTPANYGTSPGAVVAGSVNAFVTNTVATTLASTTITGTVAVTQSTSPWVVSLASTTITGTVAVTQSTSPWVVAGALTNNNAAPTATLIGVLPAIAETAYTTVTYTTGDLVLPVTDLHGALNQDLQAVAGVQLGATAVTAFGTAPAAANVPGVNASIYAGTTGLTAAAKGTQGTNALTVQDYKDSGRTYVTLFADAVNSTITDALITFQYNKGGTVTTGVTNYQVTAGKTLRIQSISVAASASGSTVQCKFRVRSGAATLSATSPILWGRFQASNASLPGESTSDIPDGLEIAAGQQIGVSGIQLSGSAGNTQWTISIVGFEY